MEPTLYGYWRSSCSYRVRIVLNLKKIAFATVPVHLVRNEQLSPEHAARAPMRAVPALAIDGLVLSQSPAIAEYLDETRPEPPLLPRGAGAGAAAARARVRAVCAAICDIQPVGNLRVLRHVMGALPPEAAREAREAARDAWSRKWIGEGLAGVEALVAATAGACCVGDDVTLADAFLVPQLYNAERAGLDVGAAFPTLARVAKHLAALPAFADAHPSRAPDAE